MSTLTVHPDRSHTCMMPLDFQPRLGALPEVTAAVAAAFGVGCMAGSFLNVVAHRVPRGETVVLGRSHCPACGATIRARDNVPIVGWLVLRGRCRDCGAAISPRYPLVEAACGGLAAVLAAVEAAAHRSDPAAAVAAWAGGLAVSLTIVAWSLLAARGHAVSRRTLVVAALAASAAAAIVPALRPVPAGCPTAPGWVPGEWIACLVASAAGMAAAWLAGRAGGRPARMAGVVVGAALGWQAAVLAAGAAILGGRLGRNPATACLATTVAVLCRHPLERAWEAACRSIGG
jgi:leader peptidase (prepilin peptidase)/N-methyltransferase